MPGLVKSHAKLADIPRMWWVIGIIVVLWIISAFGEWVKEALRQFRHGPTRDPLTVRRQQQEERRQQCEERHREFEAERARAQRKNLAEVDRLLHEHRDLITKFLEITDRRISVLDDYGDESWDMLPKQIVECLCKIGDREGVARRDIREWLKDRNRSTVKLDLAWCEDVQAQFIELATRLEARFRAPLIIP